MRKTKTLNLLLVPFVLLLSACSRGNVHYYDTSLVTPGESVTVERGETIYTIAKKYNVSMGDIIGLNQLQAPYRLTMGQSLTLPAGSHTSSSVSTWLPSSVPVTTVTTQELTAPAPAYYGGNYGTQPSVTGQILQQPAYGTPYIPSPSAANDGYIVDNSVGSSSISPENSKQGIAAQQLAPPPVQQPYSNYNNSPSMNMATSRLMPAPVAGAPAFAWPVKGPILSGYGPKEGGLNNDGVNIAAPRSAPVMASAGGTVVYAGNEMKGFGNLVLIRHEGGWITAYAHLERMLVENDAVVAPGDMIGTVGTSGGVGSPQLHFEIRQGGKPVDPQPYLSRAG